MSFLFIQESCTVLENLNYSSQLKKKNVLRNFGCVVRVHISVHGPFSSGQQPYITNEPLSHHGPAATL